MTAARRVEKRELVKLICGACLKGKTGILHASAIAIDRQRRQHEELKNIDGQLAFDDLDAAVEIAPK
jgi:hypothetical protein